MAGNPKQKIKLLSVLDILNKYTDENHPLDAVGICDILKDKYNIEAERKSIYDDISVLLDFGYDIIKTRTPKFGYFLAYRDFDTPEISLLIDAVESADFITPKKTKELVSKLEGLTSKWQADELNKRVFIDNSNKCANEEIYYTIDKINRAIKECKKITMKYIRRCLGENNRISENIRELEVSPYALVWENDHYYLVGNIDKYDNLIHMRIDRMKNVEVTKKPYRHFSRVSEYKAFFDTADYVRKSFNMFGGELKSIELKCKNSLLEQVIDRFGDKLYLRPNDDETFTFLTKANISGGLISWILQFGGDMEAVNPPELRESVKDRVENIAKIYEVK